MRVGEYRKRMSVKVLAVIVSLFICVAMIPLETKAVSSEEEAVTQQEKATGVDTVYCTAFGDSIAKGYAGKGQEDLRSYTP